MQSLELSPDHAAVLKNYLERTLADLSVEIAATDGLDYREHLKGERRLLAETLVQLTGAARASTIESELLELEKQYWQAIKDKDIDAAMRMTDDPCIIAGAQGIQRADKPTVEAGMRAMEYTLNDFELKDAEIRMLGEDVAIMAYKVREDLIVEGAPVTLEAAESSTWVQRDGRWLCALHTESLAGDPFGRDRRSA